MRSLTDVVREGFIWGIGITRPKPGREHQAGIYITATLIACLLGVAGMFFLLLSHL